MKIAFFGTPEFAGNILTGILKFPEIDCKLVVSQPNRAIGRKQILEATPVKQTALVNSIEILQPEKIKKNIEFHEYLKSLDLDFILVVAYGKIIPKEILEIPKYGCINLHGSILPKYRGASPIQAAVKSGDIETGLTTMYMSEGMDEGNILRIQKVEIQSSDTSLDIFRKFTDTGPQLIKTTFEGIISGELLGIPQNEDLATYCTKISREDGEVFFQKQGAQEIYNIFRAFTPWPGIYTYFDNKRFVFEGVILHKEQGKISGNVGQCIKLSKNRYGIMCTDKIILEILRVKLEGKKSIDISSFMNGNKEILGYIFA